MGYSSRLSLATLAIIFPLSAMAQPSNLYVGFSYLRATPGVPVNSDRLNLFGWETATTFKILPVFGITLDASGDYGPTTVTSIPEGSGPQPVIRTTQTTYQQYHFLAGPNVVPIRSHSLWLSLHALAGGALANTILSRPYIPPGEAIAGGGTAAAFSAAAGGSLDVRLTEHVAYRILQAEAVWTRFGTHVQTDIRGSTGITFLFGR
jgi:hypothetical protein